MNRCRRPVFESWGLGCLSGLSHESRGRLTYQRPVLSIIGPASLARHATKESAWRIKVFHIRNDTFPSRALRPPPFSKGYEQEALSEECGILNG